MIYRLLEILNLFEFRSGPSRVIGKKEIAYLDVVSSKFRRQLADRQKAVLPSCDIQIVCSPDKVENLRIVRGEYDTCSIWIRLLRIK